MKAILCGFAIAAVLFSVPASADVAYTNGPLNGTIGAWDITDYQVADSFTLGSAETLTSVTFGAWTPSADSFATVTSVDWYIVSDLSTCPVTCTTGLYDGLGGVSQTLGFKTAQYNINSETFALPDVALGPGTFWLVLGNGNDNYSAPVFWDENDGPSEAADSDVAGGYITSPDSCATGGSTGYCSESFTITNSSSVPEPGTVAPGGFGLLLLGALRRRRNR